MSVIFMAILLSPAQLLLSPVRLSFLSATSFIGDLAPDCAANADLPAKQSDDLATYPVPTIMTMFDLSYESKRFWRCAARYREPIWWKNAVKPIDNESTESMNVNEGWLKLSYKKHICNLL